MKSKKNINDGEINRINTNVFCVELHNVCIFILYVYMIICLWCQTWIYLNLSLQFTKKLII